MPRRDDDQVRLPFVLGPVSNGEFLPAAASLRDVSIAEAALRRANAAADRLGMDRRRFLQTSGGMAALLGAINAAACSGAGARHHLSGASPGGSFLTPSPENLPACEHVLSGGGRSAAVSCCAGARTRQARGSRLDRELPPRGRPAGKARSADAKQVRRSTG